MARFAMPLDSIPATTSSMPTGAQPMEWNVVTQPTRAGVAEADNPAASERMEEEEVLHASLKAGSAAQIVVAVIAVLGLIYILKVVLVTILTAMLLAFALDPLVMQLSRIRIPRAVGSLLAVALMVGLAMGLTHFFYSRAVDFATQLPRYSSKIRSAI